MKVKSVLLESLVKRIRV